MNTLATFVALVIFASMMEYFVYIIATLFPATTRGLRAELWWITAHITGPIFLINHLSLSLQGKWEWYDPLIFAANVAYWWFAVVKDKDKDDRWKKRRKKALAKVQEKAGRLVVAPVPVHEMR